MENKPSAPGNFEDLKAYLSRPVEDLGSMSVRLRNGLKHVEADLVAHIYALTRGHLLRTPNFGHKTLNELRDLLAQAGVPWDAVDFQDPQRVWRMEWQNIDGVDRLAYVGISAEEFQNFLTPDQLRPIDLAVTLDNEAAALSHFLPDYAHQMLSQKFLSAVLNDPSVKKEVRKILESAVQARLERKGGPA